MAFESEWNSPLFVDMYECFFLSDVRKEPATKEEFLDAGLSEAVFLEYISYVMRLYSEYFADSYEINSKYPVSYPNIDALWTSFAKFCVEHNLTYERAASSGSYAPYRLRMFQFIDHCKECPDTIHVCTVDEFRLAVEQELAYRPQDWYLDLRYRVEIFEDDYDGDVSRLMRYDLELEKMVLLTELEAQDLLARIRGDIANLLNASESETPPRALNGKDMFDSDYDDIIEEQEQWLVRHRDRDQEFTLLCDACAKVMTVIDSGVHEKIFASVPDDTLYIHKRKIICERNSHRIEQATAVLRDGSGADIELNVSHCLDCEKFFLQYTIYQFYREKYGTILGNIRMTKNGDFSDAGYELADESPLRLCGYSVSQKAGLSQRERQTIISSCIESGAMTKEGVIHLLNWFIEVNGAKRGNELAVRKWQEDLDFALAYNTSRQEHYQITKIAKYSRNRFLIGRHNQ